MFISEIPSPDLNVNMCTDFETSKRGIRFYRSRFDWNNWVLIFLPCIRTLSSSFKWRKSDRERSRRSGMTCNTHTHRHTQNFTATTAWTPARIAHSRHTFLVSVTLWLAFPGVAVSAGAFHTSSLSACEQHWSDGQRRRGTGVQSGR